MGNLDSGFFFFHETIITSPVQVSDSHNIINLYEPLFPLTDMTCHPIFYKLRLKQGIFKLKMFPEIISKLLNVGETHSGKFHQIDRYHFLAGKILRSTPSTPPRSRNIWFFLFYGIFKEFKPTLNSQNILEKVFQKNAF